jgi:hypothetical protein
LDLEPQEQAAAYHVFSATLPPELTSPKPHRPDPFARKKTRRMVTRRV